jgi:vacuolar-type H+-ATPase subunit I/STV1
MGYGICTVFGVVHIVFFYHISLIVLYILQRFRSFSRVLALALAHFAIQIVCA